MPGWTCIWVLILLILSLTKSSLSMAGSGLMSGRMVFTLRPNSSSAGLAPVVSVDIHVWVPVLGGAGVLHLLDMLVLCHAHRIP